MPTTLKKILAEKDTIKKIDLSEQYDLNEIPGIIKECKQLEKLDVSFTGISEIPDFVFKLPKLKELNFSSCRKLKKQPTLFTLQQPIEKLSVYIGQNQTIPKEIEALKNLKSLTISGFVKKVPPFIFDIKSLETLEFVDSQVASLPPEVAKLDKLKSVSFWQNIYNLKKKMVKLKLKEMFENLSGCKNLKKLYLGSNGITEIPENIRELKNLQVFSAPQNGLVSLPDSIYELAHLKELDLGINILKELPAGIGKLSQLKILKLNSNWHNQFDAKNLFDEISGLSNLEVLELWSCPIKEIPETISELKKLKMLELSGTLLTKLPKSILTMHHLEKLRIPGNNISSREIEEIQSKLNKTKVILN